MADVHPIRDFRTVVAVERAVWAELRRRRIRRLVARGRLLKAQRIILKVYAREARRG